MSDGRAIEDELLVLRCRQGDAASLDSLLVRWQERLWRHALRVTGDPDAAWDVLQEALLVIARQIRRLEAESVFGVWAYRIVGHKARDWLRQHLRRRERETRYAQLRHSEGIDADEPTPEVPGVKAAWRRLSSTDHTLLTLRFKDGFSIDEMAEALGIPAGTVKSRLHYAKQRLRAMMEKSHE